MKKLLLRTMVLLCALVVGSMNGWAAVNVPTPEAGTFVIEFYDSEKLESTSGTGLTSSNYLNFVGVPTGITKANLVSGVTTSGTVAYGKNGGLTLGTSSANSNSVTFTIGSSYEVTKCTVYATKYEDGRWLLNGNAASSGSIGDKGANISTITSPLVWNFATGQKSLAFTKDNGSGNNQKRLTIYRIVCEYTASTTPTCATPTFSPAAGLYTSAQSVTLSCSTEEATIHYTTDGSTPTSSSTAYTGAINVSATTTIKAIATKNGYDNSSVASATYTIVTHAGTQDDPYTVAEARTAIDANSGITNVYVRGIVCTGGSSLSSGKMNYWISDDGTETNKLEAYKGKNLNNTDFAATSDVGVNDVVVIYGTLAKFGSTYEFIEGNYLVSLQQSTKPIINASNKTINFDATSGEIAYTIENPTSATLTAAKTTGDWISNVAVDAGNNKVTFTATANTGAQRQGTITLSYTGADDKVITVTQKKYGIATLPFAFDGGKGDIESTDDCFGLTHNGLGTPDYGSSPKLKFDGTGDNVILRFNEEPGILSFSVKGNSFSGGTFTVQTSADGTAYTDLDSYTTLGDAETKTYNLESSVRYVKWIYTSKSSGNVALGNINLALPGEPSLPVVDDVAHTVTLTTTANMEGWRTFTPSKADQNYTADADVYYVSASGATTVTLTKIDDGVPANTPVILHKTSGTTITLTETATVITAPGASNLLAVSTANQNLGKVFRLGYKSGAGKGVGFYSYTSANAPAGIIYVNAPSAARDFLNFDFGDEATGVNDVRGKMSDVRGDYYDLQGRKVANPTKGLYIVNGKKVIIK